MTAPARVREADLTTAKPLVMRRGLRREQAAAYVGVSPTKFDDWIARGKMPPGRKIDGVVLWDVVEIDVMFDAFYYGEDAENGRAKGWDE